MTRRLTASLLWLALAGPTAAMLVPATAQARPATAAISAQPASSPRPGSGTPAAAEDIREIRGPVALPKPSPIWWYAAGALVAGAAALVATGLRKRRPRPAPPHVRALSALESQRRSPEASAQVFSEMLSETVRSYVEESFPIRAAHRTTEELLADLMADSSPVAAQRDLLGAFLHHCDLAKFGRWSLTAGDRDAMLDSAEAFVRATSLPSPIPSPKPESAVAGAGQFA